MRGLVNMIISKFTRLKCYRLIGLVLSFPIYILIVDLSGIFRHLQERSYETEFSYPLELPNFVETVHSYRLGKNVIVPPINNLYSSFNINQESFEKCSDTHQLEFLILIKSAPSNFQQRQAIRETWKTSLNGFNSKLAFFIGKSALQNSDPEKGRELELSLLQESSANNDIIRLESVDSYYNNTIKTMLEMRWAVESCSNFNYALLIDDDYFLSVKNLLRFVDNPKEYPVSSNKKEEPSGKTDIVTLDKLYAGYRMFPPPHRHKIMTKWFVSLNEYPYDYFPPYITAGAVLLSQPALIDIYYASFYTAPFRFDDVYVAICAKKMNITPVNSEYFRFWSTRDESPEKDLIASHGFSQPERLHRFWKIQKSNGYC